MAGFILDCSIAVSWCIEDEASDQTDELLELTKEHGAIVPSLWSLEVANVFINACKRGRISFDIAQKQLANLQALPIKIEPEDNRIIFKQIFQLANSHNLSVYDANYLGLALDKKLPLASKDKALNNAAKKLGIECLYN